MSRLAALLLAVSLCWLTLPEADCQGQAPTTGAPAPPKTVLTQPGKLAFQDDCNQPLNKDWSLGNKGKWEIVNGALKVSELKEDSHAAVKRRPYEFRSAAIAYEFKLDGARATTLSINGQGGHVCRVRIGPDGFSVNKDKDKKSGDKAVVLDECKVAIKAGEWHTLVVEMHGQEMVACLDGKHYAFGAHNGIDVPKTSVGLTVGGESVCFRNLRVWEATANPNWLATKAKLKS